MSPEKGQAPPEHGRPPAQSGAVPGRADGLGDQGDQCSMAYPEGGREAWGVVFGSFCLFMSIFGIVNTSAVFQSYYLENQLEEYSPSEVGWIFSTYLFVVYFVGLGVGPVFDRHGARELVFVGSSLMVASPFILGSCTGETCPALSQFSRKHLLRQV